MGDNLSSGLIWQRSGSDSLIKYAQTEAYIDSLNKIKFAGFDDWRLPTLEEAMSLMEPERRNGSLFINPVFDKHQYLIWTADKASVSAAWLVDFNFGYCYNVGGGYSSVRAVRSRQSLDH